jgi:hypothetical protein
MSKLCWDKARRNPRGYVSVTDGPEEIAGVDRWGSKKGKRLDCGSSSQVHELPRAKAGKPKGTADRAWPEIKDGRTRSSSGTSPKPLRIGKAHRRRAARLAAKLKELETEALTKLLQQLEKETLRQLNAALKLGDGGADDVRL